MHSGHPDTRAPATLITFFFWQCDEGVTALIQALTFNSTLEIIGTLLEAGTNVKVKNKGGKTVIDCAKENEKIYKTKAYWKLNDALYE